MDLLVYIPGDLEWASDADENFTDFFVGSANDDRITEVVSGDYIRTAIGATVKANIFATETTLFKITWTQLAGFGKPLVSHEVKVVNKAAQAAKMVLWYILLSVLIGGVAYALMM